jgi:predicted nucleotidyltransferase
MQSIIEAHRDEVHRLCRQFGVQSLDVFGSAAGDAFDPRRSDIDFVVDFGPGAQPDLFNRYFGLNEALAALFGRKVDLVMPGGMVNPCFVDSVNRTRRPVYARPLTEAA